MSKHDNVIKIVVIIPVLFSYQNNHSDYKMNK